MDVEIRHDEQAKTYTAAMEGQEVGHLNYHVAPDGVIDFTHTWVPPEHRGLGIADRLVEQALDETLERGQRFRASCWFVAAFARRHPRYEQALA